MIKLASFAVGALVVMTLVPASSASAVGQRDTVAKPPNACKTVTTAAADKLFKVSKRTRPTETLIKGSTYKTCVISVGTKVVKVETQRTTGKATPGYRCYRHQALGSGGKICVSRSKKSPGATALFARHGVHVIDFYTKTLAHHGKSLYRFAIAQRKRL